ncbi:MAG: tRNA (guanine(26)-N(2))-dimethyltransferase [Nitrososphaerales archaeon]|nr:tRNA (guanine(26)-N(2))-dimethyltransferase [Nitrososphaerales archaeon]
MNLVTILEGKTRLTVPKASVAGPVPPTTPVFFNPAASLNRDISVAVTQADRGRTFCDALAGVGARGVRVANEVGRRMDVTMVDFNSDSLKLAARSARLNGVSKRCSFVTEEANTFLHSLFRRDQKFDYVDIDPFGTPAPYLQAAFKAVSGGGLVSVTATDTAVLCGVYPHVARRRYWATPLNNSFHHETAVRILANACRRVAATIDIGVAPVLAHSTRHYLRVFLRAEVGASKADESMKNEGYVIRCAKCGHVTQATEPSSKCEKCGARARSAGPLWAGRMVDQGVLEATLLACRKRKFAMAAKVIESLVGLNEFPPYSYSLEEICSTLKVASVSPEKVAESLESKGFKTHGQPFEKTGLKTDALHEDVVSAVREAANRRAGNGQDGFDDPVQPSQ